MTRSRVLTGIISAVFCLTLVSSVRADNAHGDLLLEKLIYAERHDLSVVDIQIDTAYLYAGHFENNNGKHRGFSVAMVHYGPTLGIVKPSQPTVASQNPEPTAMVLLGTGLAAAAAFARKIGRKRRY